MSDPLDRVGTELSEALRRELPRVRRRRRVAAVASLLAAAVAVPATGAVTNWAGLAGGETPLPTQVPGELRLQLAGARDEAGPWRLDVYRAALGGTRGRIGVCVFVSRETGGGGRCVATADVGPLVDAGLDQQARVAGGIVRSAVDRVEVTIDRYEGGRSRVVALTPKDAPEGELARRALPAGLGSYAVVLDRDEGSVAGVRALAADGRTVATAGRPAAGNQAITTPSPALLEDQTP